MAHLLIALRRRRAMAARYVRPAFGRDYDDVPPLRSRFRGRTGQAMTVTVEFQETA